MSSFRIGQRIEIDLFGLRVSGLTPNGAEASGTVVALYPGAITVRLRRAGGTPAEVTVSRRRVLGMGPSLGGQ
jgi:hypothetical protein